MLALAANPAPAATFTVTKTTDDDGACDPLDCALREAVLAANANPGHDVIRVPAGTYRLTIPDPRDPIFREGNLVLRDDVAMLGQGPGPAVIVGDGLDGVLTALSSTVELRNLTVTGGSDQGLGGGIRVLKANATIVDCWITDNETQGDGGGLSVLSNSSVVLENVTISDNEARGAGGGIVRNGIGHSFPANLTLINTTVSGNRASSGAAIYSLSGGQLAIINSTIARNVGALHVTGVSHHSGPPPTFANSIFEGACGGRFNLYISYGGNIQGIFDNCSFNHPTDQTAVADLEIAPLALNGGTTLTHRLLPGSPALDRGVSTSCPSTDQRDVARPQDGDGDGVAACDVGAFEATAADLVVVPVLDRLGLLLLGTLLTAAALSILRANR